jgi:hypothetical protein
MGLIDLKTDLKSLRYGKDTIGGGYSGQPYIQTPIPESFNDLGANEDFILRGGINAVRDSATDIRRLTKMFFDLKSPNGVLFIAKQNLLSQTAVRTQTSGIVNEGIYTPLNTLAEAGVVAFGGHLNKQGVNPFTYTGAYANNDNLYYTRMVNYNIEAIQSPDGILKNRLVALQQSKILNVSIGGFDKTSNISSLPSDILTYEGGPGSNLGVGKTNIRFSSQRTGINNPLWNSYVNSISSWTAPQDARGFRANGVISLEDYKYNPLTSGISEKGGIYDELLGVGDREYENRDLDGNILQSNNVYKSGSLQPYTPVTQGQKIQTTVNVDNVRVGGLQVDTEKPWTKSPQYLLPSFNVNSPQSGSLSKIPTATPKPPLAINPSGSNYIDGANFRVSGSRGVSDKLGLDQPPILPANVYQSGSITKTNPSVVTNNQTITYSPTLLQQSPSYDKSGRLIDFRKVLRENLRNQDKTKNTATGQLTLAPDYATKNVGVRNQIGNPGANRKNKNYSSYTRGVVYPGNTTKPLDEINASKIGADPSLYNDLVTFNICPLNNQNWMTFRAFLGSFSDSYSGAVNTQQYVGRGENFYTYQGFTRKISLSWTVAALSKQELLPMHKKLSYLASQTAPVYNANGFMQGPLVKLTVGGYIHQLPGYIESITYDIGEDSNWEIQINDNGGIDRTTSELPHIIKVTGFSFVPISNYLPQQGAHFIDLWNGQKTLWENNTTSTN